MLIKDKDINHIIPIVVNKTRSCACKLKYLLLWLVNLEFFFVTFQEKWFGWAMGNETFYWDGLNEFAKAKINANECSFRVLKLIAA